MTQLLGARVRFYLVGEETPIECVVDGTFREMGERGYRIRCDDGTKFMLFFSSITMISVLTKPLKVRARLRDINKKDCEKNKTP